MECERCKGHIDRFDESYSEVNTEHGHYYVCEECAEEVLR